MCLPKMCHCSQGSEMDSNVKPCCRNWQPLTRPCRRNKRSRRMQQPQPVDALMAKHRHLLLCEVLLLPEQADFDAAMRQKQALEDDAAATKRKMDGANALLGALAGEEARWTEQSKAFDDQISRLTGS